MLQTWPKTILQWIKSDEHEFKPGPTAHYNKFGYLINTNLWITLVLAQGFNGFSRGNPRSHH